MSILDDLDRKISEIGKGALQKTKNVSESVKLSSLIKEEEEHIKNLYEKIGIYCYQKKIMPGEIELADIYKAIDEKAQELENYKQQLRKIKKMISCENCRADNPADAAFCIGCGVSLRKPVSEQKDSADRVCISCGMEMAKDQIFCTNCGAKYEERPEQKEPVEKSVIEDESKNQKSTLPEKPDTAIRVCSSCGSELAEDLVFCTSCGTRYEDKILNHDGVSEKDAAPLVEDKSQVLRQKRICKKCGAEVASDQKFCISCGEVYQQEINTISCPSCGKILKPSQRFCTGCGKKMQ